MVTLSNGIPGIAVGMSQFQWRVPTERFEAKTNPKENDRRLQPLYLANKLRAHKTGWGHPSFRIYPLRITARPNEKKTKAKNKSEKNETHPALFGKKRGRNTNPGYA